MWKELYRSTVAAEMALEDECGGDPTAKWGRHVPTEGGKFAIAFSGGMRNFIATW
jgi:hypothetical protein